MRPWSHIFIFRIKVNLPSLNNIAKRILNTPLGGEHVMCWGSERAWTCSLKAWYKHISPSLVGPQFPWKIVWNLYLPSKLKMFAWKVLLDILSLQPKLGSQSDPLASLCVLCKDRLETNDSLSTMRRFTTLIRNLLP